MDTCPCGPCCLAPGGGLEMPGRARQSARNIFISVDAILHHLIDHCLRHWKLLGGATPLLRAQGISTLMGFKRHTGRSEPPSN